MEFKYILYIYKYFILVKKIFMNANVIGTIAGNI